MPGLQANSALSQPNKKEAATQVENLSVPNNNPLKEYVAGGPLSYLQDYYRALPHYIDDISADFGPDLYERMLKDAQVTSAFESIRMSVLSSGISFLNPVQDPNDPKFELAGEIQQFVERNLTQRLNQPFTQICYDLLEGMALGHKVAELVYEYADEDEISQDQGRICLKAIKVKPQRATAFVVDAYYNVVALIGLLPGQGASAIVTQGLIGIPSSNDTAAKDTPSNLLPREKFAIFTYRPQDADPRGTSILRPAYDPWWSKQQAKRDYLAYLGRFGGPFLIGYTPEGSQSFAVSDSYGNPTTDSTGTQQYFSPEEIMGATLASFKNGTYAVFSGGHKVDTIESSGDGSAFERAFTFYNSEITKGIQYQTLATNEGQHQSRAASQTHENILDKIINFAKEALANCINWDVIYNLVRYNFGEDAAHNLAPKISFSAGAAQDFAADAAAIASLQSAGYLHPSQYAGIDSRLGLPARDMEADQPVQPTAPDSQAAPASSTASLKPESDLNSNSNGGIQA